MENHDEFDFLNINSSLYKTRISKKFAARKAYAPVNPKYILSFIPGTVMDIMVSPGQTVNKGESLLILDAMKMQNLMKSSLDGTIKTILVKKGDKVSKGTLLIEME
jgi:biotin carboxyl carrier protein